MLYFYVFLIQFYKFVLFLKSITKLVKHCNKNDEIKARVVELETAFSRENLTKKLLYGSYMGFSGQTHNICRSDSSYFSQMPHLIATPIRFNILLDIEH